MRILVVDDEQDLCEILQYNLETEGYEVDTANSAEEAMQMQITDYSLLLLDIMMGEMSGFQMARRLKENPATAHIPIIFITALDNEDSTVKGLNIGADELMERFVRGDGSRNTEGSGLGLNIAKSLMELQKGELQLLVDGDLFKVTLIFPGI